jgi:hypothetical protein
MGVHTLLLAFGGALIGANGLAAIIHRVLGRNMSWFVSEHSALLLYGPASFGGSSPTLSSFQHFLLMWVLSYSCIAGGLSECNKAHHAQLPIIDAIAASAARPWLYVPFVPWRSPTICRAVSWHATE